MLYSDVTTALAILAQQNDALGTYTFVQSPDFAAYLPRVIDYAEGRLYREIVVLATRSTEANNTVQKGLRTLPLNLFTPQPIVVEGLALITPVGTPPQSGRRWQYHKTSIDFIDMVWPQENVTMAPSSAPLGELWWAPLDHQTIIIAPTPDQAYIAEITGIFRPTPLSANNPATYLSLFYPDLFLTACMIAVAGFQRDYGGQSDDPKLALSWEQQYQALKASALEEEHRRRGTGVGGGTAPPVASPETPKRT